MGRTGAGKSSVIAALTRLVEPCGGDITVDGMHTLRMGLRDLRMNLTVISQDPLFFRCVLVCGCCGLAPRMCRTHVYGNSSRLRLTLLTSSHLHSGSVRKNIDPFGDFTDAAIWEVCHGPRVAMAF